MMLSYDAIKLRWLQLKEQFVLTLKNRLSALQYEYEDGSYSEETKAQ